MSEEVASAFVERRAFEAALAETESYRAANVALESQIGQAHADLLLAQADAETLAVAVRAWASTHQPMECEECEDLVTLARAAHPGTPLADEVRAARAAAQERMEMLIAMRVELAAVRAEFDLVRADTVQLMAERDAARAREAGLKLAADQYSESRDQWMLKAKAAIQRGAADHAVTDEVRAARAANHIMYEALRQIDKHQEGAYTTEEGAGANVEACEWCGDMRDIASAALARVKAGGK